MRLGLIGRGPFGEAYAKTLRALGIDFWRAGRDWIHQEYWKVDGLIVASAAESHFDIASFAIRKGFPVIVEKPLCLDADSARRLLDMTGPTSVVFTGYTRLYSPAWRAFKADLGEIESVSMIAGSHRGKDGWLLDWGAHLVALCIDIGFDPEDAELHMMFDDIALSVTVNGNKHFMDGPTTPTPLEVLITEFVAAIEKGERNIGSLELGVKVVETLEMMHERSSATT